jgi:hypothetical protein
MYAAVGAGVGAAGAAITGGDIGKGALMGAVIGGATGGLGLYTGEAGFAFGAGGTGPMGFSGFGEVFGMAGSATAEKFALEQAASGSLGGVFGSGFGPDISIGKALIGGGGLLAAGGQMELAEAQAAEVDFKTVEKMEVAAFNTLATDRDVREFKRKGSALTGARRAVSAASGIRGSTGQALSVTTELEDEIEYQAALIREGGALETGALLREAEFLTTQRASLLAGGRIARGGTLLTTAGRLFA